MSENNINFEVKSRIMGEVPSFNNAKVKVFGVGGAGGNTVNRMKQMDIEGVEYYAVNTDAMALDLSLADHKIVIGEKSTKSLGAGMDPDVGRKAIEENIDDIKEAMKGADMVFVAAGMGGGTGTGAAPVVASIARELGILTVAVVTKPFRWEGNARSSIALRGIENLRNAVDTIIVVENKKLLSLLQNSNQKATMEEAFKIADEILGNAVKSICGIMFNHGLVHVDFADIRKVMQNGGTALMGSGYAQGENRGIIAADMALASPLLEDINIEGASGVLVNVAHGENYSLLEHSDAMDHIYEKVGEEGDPNIIVGDIMDPSLGDKVCITIIATGCGGTAPAPVKAPMFGGQSFGSSAMSQPTIPMHTISQTVAQPAVQPATPRPTGFNVFDFGKIKDDSEQPEMFQRPVHKPAPQPETVAPVVPSSTESLPTVSETQVIASVDCSTFGSPAFNANEPAEEMVAQGSETAEFPAVAEEDRFNGGLGSQEKLPTNTPAYGRIKERSPEPAIAAVPNNVILDSSVDLSIPPYIRNNMCNF